MDPKVSQLEELAMMLAKNSNKNNALTKKRKCENDQAAYINYDTSEEINRFLNGIHYTHNQNNADNFNSTQKNLHNFDSYKKITYLIRYHHGMILSFVKDSNSFAEYIVNFNDIKNLKFYHINSYGNRPFRFTIGRRIFYIAENEILYFISNNVLQPFIVNNGIYAWKFKNMISTRSYVYIDIQFEKTMVFNKYDLQTLDVFRNAQMEFSRPMFFCQYLHNDVYNLYLINTATIKNGLLGHDNIIYEVYNNRLTPLIIHGKNYLWQFVF